jgi:hypothetical protein
MNKRTILPAATHLLGRYLKLWVFIFLLLLLFSPSTGSCRSVFDQNVYANRHTFTTEAGRQIAVRLNAPGSDSYMTLIGPSGESIVEDDGGGGVENSRIPAVTGCFTVLAETSKHSTPERREISLDLTDQFPPAAKPGRAHG